MEGEGLGRSGDAAAPLSTAAVAAAAGYSAQQVRVLEAQGVIPAATRSRNGYREFSVAHVRALHAYRDLAGAVGPVAARRVMREIALLPTEQAAAVVMKLHVDLDRERERALVAREALTSIRTEAITEAPPTARDTMTITELSRALGVRSSTLRFWESRGLVAPVRTTTRAGTARRYPPPAIAEARITAALRAGGYRIPDIQQAITAVRELTDVSSSVAALDAHLHAIGHRALALLRAGAWLAESAATSGEDA